VMKVEYDFSDKTDIVIHGREESCIYAFYLMHHLIEGGFQPIPSTILCLDVALHAFYISLTFDWCVDVPILIFCSIRIAPTQLLRACQLIFLIVFVET